MRTPWLSESSLRIAVENGWYHVLNRGIDGWQLFPDDRANEEMAGLGKWEEGWKESVKASILHGTEKFVAGMLKELKGDRREQTGIRERSV